MRMLVNSRKHTRSRTYDFLLKGLIFCHECGYPMAVLNRPPVSGEDRLFFVCRTYQRFTKAGVCSCHSIKEQVVTEAVLAKVREVCEAYLDPKKLQPIAADAVEKARKAENHEAEIQSIQSKIDSLTANLDKMYMDRLTGLLAEADFERIYQRVKIDKNFSGRKVEGTGVTERKSGQQRRPSQRTGSAISGFRLHQPGTLGQSHRTSRTDRRQTNHHQIPLP